MPHQHERPSVRPEIAVPTAGTSNHGEYSFAGLSSKNTVVGPSSAFACLRVSRSAQLAMVSDSGSGAGAVVSATTGGVVESAVDGAADGRVTAKEHPESAETNNVDTTAAEIRDAVVEVPFTRVMCVSFALSSAGILSYPRLYQCDA
jgi:hypothetical protein